jgi:hypothetical protein
MVLHIVLAALLQAGITWLCLPACPRDVCWVQLLSHSKHASATAWVPFVAQSWCD